MTVQEFLKLLEEALYGLPYEDIQKSLDFYSEILADQIEEGISEEDAVSQIGSIDEIAKQILIDTPITKLVKQKIKPERRISVGEIVLLVLGSPIWLSLIISAIAVVMAIYISLWSVVISLWACEVAFLGSVFGAFAVAVILFITGQNFHAGMIMLAVGLFLIGFSIVFFFVCQITTKGMIYLTKKITLWIKSCFLRKR